MTNVWVISDKRTPGILGLNSILYSPAFSMIRFVNSANPFDDISTVLPFSKYPVLSPNTFATKGKSAAKGIPSRSKLLTEGPLGHGALLFSYCLGSIISG